MTLQSEKRFKGQFLCFFFKKTRQKSASLELFFGLLAFVVGKLWPKHNNDLIS